MTSNMPIVHTTAPDVQSVADVTDALTAAGIEHHGVANLYVKLDGELYALLIDEVDADADVVFTVGERI